MSELLLEFGAKDKVLEVGTGSGYQTAVLAQLCQQVFSVERILPLQERAASVLGYLGLNNVSLFHTDGGMGLEHEAPFDAIMVTAAPSVIPESLKKQMKVGGVLVAPVGDDEQKLVRILRRSDSHFETKVIEPVKFVPLLDGLVS
jgi:protein-L-isoaspartate(D-aspartate) O-methyltransferase